MSGSSSLKISWYSETKSVKAGETFLLIIFGFTRTANSSAFLFRTSFLMALIEIRLKVTILHMRFALRGRIIFTEPSARFTRRYAVRQSMFGLCWYNHFLPITNFTSPESGRTKSFSSLVISSTVNLAVFVPFEDIMEPFPSSTSCTDLENERPSRLIRVDKTVSSTWVKVSHYSGSIQGTVV